MELDADHFHRMNEQKKLWIKFTSQKEIHVSEIDSDGGFGCFHRLFFSSFCFAI